MGNAVSSLYHYPGLAVNADTLSKGVVRTIAKKGVMHIVISRIGINMPGMLE